MHPDSLEFLALAVAGSRLWGCVLMGPWARREGLGATDPGPSFVVWADVTRDLHASGCERSMGKTHSMPVFFLVNG